MFQNPAIPAVSRLNYFLRGDLERQIEALIEHNHRRTLRSQGHG
jgi:hypothetical protein